jgi:hypothetical protein
MSEVPIRDDSQVMMQIAARIARATLVTVWFGIWCLGPVVLLYMGIDDPRDIFPNLLSVVGCVVLVLGWLYISIYFAIFDQLPDSML